MKDWLRLAYSSIMSYNFFDKKRIIICLGNGQRHEKQERGKATWDFVLKWFLSIFLITSYFQVKLETSLSFQWASPNFIQ